VTESEVMDLLAARYPAPAWAFLPQVRNGTGWQRETSRWADAIAMGLWPSRGLSVVGFEIKVHRGDWLLELRQPAKAEDFISVCHRWWLVAGDAAIIEPGELPDTWGLMVVKGRRLKAVREAPALAPRPMDALMLAAAARRLNEVATPAAKIKAAEEAGFKRGQQDARERFAAADQEYRRLEARVGAFERASGVQLDRWSERENRLIGDAVRLVLKGKDVDARRELEGFRSRVAKVLGMIDEALNGKEVTGDR
jgi:hypothetical protein